MALFCAVIRRNLVSLLTFPFLTLSKSLHVRFRLFVTWNVHTITFFCFQVIVLLLIHVLFVLFLVTVIYNPWEFFTSALVDGLSLEFEWQQVSSSLHDSSQYSVVVWMVSPCPLISKSSSLFNHSMTVPRASITVGINATFMFHSFFHFPSKVSVFIFLFTFF